MTGVIGSVTQIKIIKYQGLENDGGGSFQQKPLQVYEAELLVLPACDQAFEQTALDRNFIVFVVVVVLILVIDFEVDVIVERVKDVLGPIV